MHWSAQYIGKKWVAGGRGPDVFDCWGLCWWIESKHYGRELPPYLINPRDTAACGKAFEGAAHSNEWVQIAKPVDGCLVGLGRGSFLLHCGLFVDVDGGIVLHAQEHSNVIAQDLARLKAEGWRRIVFYQHATWQQ